MFGNALKNPKILEMLRKRGGRPLPQPNPPKLPSPGPVERPEAKPPKRVGGPVKPPMFGGIRKMIGR
jgi:hypothetical protein